MDKHSCLYGLFVSNGEKRFIKFFGGVNVIKQGFSVTDDVLDQAGEIS
jgi:hypothetical protein